MSQIVFRIHDQRQKYFVAPGGLPGEHELALKAFPRPLCDRVYLCDKTRLCDKSIFIPHLHAAPNQLLGMLTTLIFP